MQLNEGFSLGAIINMLVQLHPNWMLRVSAFNAWTAAAKAFAVERWLELIGKRESKSCLAMLQEMLPWPPGYFQTASAWSQMAGEAIHASNARAIALHLSTSMHARPCKRYHSSQWPLA